MTPYPQSSVYETVGGWLGPEGPGDVAAQTATWGRDEWAAARHAALVHGIGPLLAARLEGSPAWAAFAAEFRAYCQEQRRLNGLRVAAMRADLAAIVQAAANLGVEVLPLKGAALVEQFYPEPSLRPMADIDVLVRPDDLGCVDAALAEMGFQAVEETPRHRAYLRGAPVVVDPELEHPDNPRGVEVHTRVGEQLRAISYEITRTLWEDARPVMLGGTPAAMPAPTALLHHLLIHTCHNIVNRRLRLIQLHDIALVAPALGAADWRALGELAAQAGEARLLYAPLALAERAFGELAPREFREQLAEATPAALRRIIDGATPGEVSLCNQDEVSPAFRLAWYRPGGERLGALLRVVLPAPAELRQRYPHRAGGLSSAYLRHIGHTAGWALRSALGRRRRQPSGG